MFSLKHNTVNQLTWEAWALVRVTAQGWLDQETSGPFLPSLTLVVQDSGYHAQLNSLNK